MDKPSPFDAADHLDSPETIADYLTEARESGDGQLIARAMETVAPAKGTAEVVKETPRA